MRISSTTLALVFYNILLFAALVVSVGAFHTGTWYGRAHGGKSFMVEPFARLAFFHMNDPDYIDTIKWRNEHECFDVIVDFYIIHIMATAFINYVYIGKIALIATAAHVSTLVPYFYASWYVSP